MKIGGLQRFSLLDYPKELSAIVFCRGCNFRCPYCHNPELVEPSLYRPLLDTEAVLRFLYKRRKKLGAVVVTGGEPTLQEELIPFLKLLKAMRYKVKLDTNGALPEALSAVLSSEVVDYIAMDIKAPLALYPSLTQSNVDSNSILQSLEMIRQSGVAYEFRTTFAPEMLSWANLAEIQPLLQAGDHYYLQACRYSNTLEDLQEHRFEDFQISAHSQYLQLLSWAAKHNIEISLRA